MLIRIMLPLILLALPLVAQTRPKPTLAEALLQSRTPLLLTDGKLTGPGAEVLSQAIGESRFVLLGEDHITREIPEFAAALCDVVRPDAYAVEVGPNATEFVNTVLHSPHRVSQMAARSKAHPNNMAFLDIREENDLAAHCAATSRNPNFQLWGLDQEFVGSAGTLLDAMMATQPGPKSRATIADAQTKERNADIEARRTGDPSKLFLLASTDSDVQSLKDAFAIDGKPATQNLLREFTESRAIYHLNAEGSPDSNRIRAELLKRHFLTHYTTLQRQIPEPRVLLKFGDFHMGKGFNILHQRDLGNFTAELADGQGAHSLHILVLGARGTHAKFGGYAKPLGQEPFVMADDRDYTWLAPAVADLLPPQAGSSGKTYTLFDLRKLRFRGIDLPRDWEQIVYGYDLFVIIPELTPAAALE
jgi:hypothetical protein